MQKETRAKKKQQDSLFFSILRGESGLFLKVMKFYNNKDSNLPTGTLDKIKIFEQ